MRSETRVRIFFVGINDCARVTLVGISGVAFPRGMAKSMIVCC